MLHPFFATLLVLRSCVWLLATDPTAYPVSYSGGVGREIYTTLTLLGPDVYTYDEWTHAGYSVHDSGHYELRHQRLRFTSIHTIHKSTVWKRVKGHRRLMDDAPKYRLLFRHTTAQWNADTILITKRRVLVNRELNMFLVKRKPK